MMKSCYGVLLLSTLIIPKLVPQNLKPMKAVLGRGGGGVTYLILTRASDPVSCLFWLLIVSVLWESQWCRRNTLFSTLECMLCRLEYFHTCLVLVNPYPLTPPPHLPGLHPHGI